MIDYVLFVDECAYYDICERFPTAGNEGGDTILLGSKIRHPSRTKK